MATNNEITTAVCDAIVGGASTPAQRDKFAKVLYETLNPDPTALPYDTLTTGQRLAVTPAAIRRWGRELVRAYNKKAYEQQAAADLDAEFGP